MGSNTQHFGYFLILSVWKWEHCASNISGIIPVLSELVKLWRRVLASFVTCCGGHDLGSGAGDIYNQRKRKHICLAHCDREQTPFPWSLKYKLEQDKCVPSHCLCQGWVTVRQMQGDWRQMQVIPRMSCLLFLQHFENALLCIYFFS